MALPGLQAPGRTLTGRKCDHLVGRRGAGLQGPVLRSDVSEQVWSDHTQWDPAAGVKAACQGLGGNRSRAAGRGLTSGGGW